jgi:FixJ family two-component response regulator
MLSHVVAGRLSKQIAGDLGRSKRPSRFTAAGDGKLGVRTFADLVRMAEKAGISR